MYITPELVWRIFLTTGSITAYLLYKKLSDSPKKTIDL